MFIIVNKNILIFDIPEVYISLKQRFSEDNEIFIIKIHINKILGNLEIKDEKPEILSITANDIQLKSNNCKYEQLIFKNKIDSNSNFNLLKIEINFQNILDGKVNLK